MSISIITLAFEPEQKGFNNETLQKFLAGKTVLQLKAEFFIQNGQAYWSILVEFELLSDPVEREKADKTLEPLQQQLYNMLRQWRKDKASEESIPVYVIATNKEMAEIAKKKPQTLDALQNIAGFGKKKCQRHGEEIITIVKRFGGKHPFPEQSGASSIAPQPEQTEINIKNGEY